MKTLILLFMIIGSSLGSYLPVLWGAGLLSASSVLFGAVGGFVGIWAGYKLTTNMGL